MTRRAIRPVSLFFAAALLAAAIAPRNAAAQEDWRAEFEAVCQQTEDSMNLTSEQVAGLIARCDKLVERIGAEGETVRKVYLRRLKMCRDLFAYVLEQRGVAATAAPLPESAPSPGATTAPAADTAPAPAK